MKWAACKSEYRCFNGAQSDWHCLWFWWIGWIPMGDGEREVVWIGDASQCSPIISSPLLPQHDSDQTSPNWSVPRLPLCLSVENNGDNNIIMIKGKKKTGEVGSGLPKFLGMCIALYKHPHYSSCLVILWLIFNCWRWLIRRSQRENLINATTTFLLSALWWAPFFLSLQALLPSYAYAYARTYLPPLTTTITYHPSISK